MVVGATSLGVNRCCSLLLAFSGLVVFAVLLHKLWNNSSSLEQFKALEVEVCLLNSSGRLYSELSEAIITMVLIMYRGFFLEIPSSNLFNILPSASVTSFP